MDKIYIIKAEYGDYDDACSVDMYATTIEGVAHGVLNSMAQEFTAAYSQMIEAMCHGVDPRSIDLMGIDEKVAQVAHNTHWSEGVQLSLYVMPCGQLFRGSEFVCCAIVDLFPEGWDEERLSREGEDFIASKAEQLAQPYEMKYEGRKY